MKVLACFSLVLAVLVLVAAGGKLEDARHAFWEKFFTDMTAEACAGDKAEVCVANSAKCYGALTSDKYKVKTEQEAAWAKARFIECAASLSIDADFSDVTLETFQSFPLPDYGFDLIQMFLHYGVPEAKLSAMTECTMREALTVLRTCLTT